MPIKRTQNDRFDCDSEDSRVGVGIFAPGPGASNWGNVITDNVLIDNGIGGVVLHNHAAPGVGGVPAQAPPGESLRLVNEIVNNQISGNGADTDDPASPGATGISILRLRLGNAGVVIAQNTFQLRKSWTSRSALRAGPCRSRWHMNSFSGIEIGASTPKAREGRSTRRQNWWGCPSGPGAAWDAPPSAAPPFMRSKLASGSAPRIQPGATVERPAEERRQTRGRVRPTKKWAFAHSQCWPNFFFYISTIPRQSRKKKIREWVRFQLRRFGPTSGCPTTQDVCKQHISNELLTKEFRC